MSMRFKGGIISATPPTTTGGESGTASGAWTLQQQMQAQASSLWPLSPLPTSLFTWGYNYIGQLGQNNLISRSSPTQVGSDINWAYVSAASSSTFGVKTDGTLWAWGRNDWGQLGLGDTIERSSPVQIGALTTWSKVASNRWATFFIRTNGNLWVSGRNVDGCMGVNQDGFLSIYARSSPVQVGSSTWTRVSTGNLGVDPFVFGIRTNNTLWAWGNGGNGRLGLNDQQNRSSPVQVGANTWLSAAPGYNFTSMVRSDGTLWGTGDNRNGGFGNGTSTGEFSSPVQIGALTNWSKVWASQGNTNVSAIKTDGTLWAWGNNSDGQVGDGTKVNRYSPVAIGALTTWTLVSVGSSFTIAAQSNGTLWSWGKNEKGQLGIGVAGVGTTYRSSPVQVGTATQWTSIATGHEQIAVVKKG